MADLNGYDGSVNFGTAHNGQIATFSVRVSRGVTEHTGFGDVGTRRLLGIFDCQGSVGGTLKYDISNSAPFPTGTSITSSWSRTGATFLFGFAGNSTSSTAAQLSVTAVVSNVNLTNDRNGNSTFAADFMNSSGSNPLLTWDETA